MYEIKFKLGNQKIDFADPEFQKRFRFIFKENGLLAKRNWDIVLQEDGTYSINYNALEPFMKRINRQLTKENTPLDEIKKEAPTVEEQRNFVRDFFGEKRKLKKKGDDAQYRK